MSMPRAHVLKTWPGPYKDTKVGVKPFELRINDRDYHVGDVLFLVLFDPDTQTTLPDDWYRGDFLVFRITCVRDWPASLRDGHVALGLGRIEPLDAARAMADILHNRLWIV